MDLIVGLIFLLVTLYLCYRIGRFILTLLGVVSPKNKITRNTKKADDSSLPSNVENTSNDIDSKTIEIKLFKNLPANTNIKLWLQPETTIIHFYELGHIGGDGLVGKTTNNKIAMHISSGLAYSAIAYKNIAKIVLHNKTQEELLDDEYLATGYKKALQELSKPTRLKSITFEFETDVDDKMRKGTVIYPEFLPTIEEHARERILKLKFVDKNGNMVGIKENEPSKIRQLLRFHFVNKRNVKATVLSTRNRQICITYQMMAEEIENKAECIEQQ